MARFLLSCIVLFAIAIIGLVIISCVDPAPTTELQYTVIPTQNPNTALVSKINETNAKVRSFSCEEIKVKTWGKGSRFSVTASMLYEKPQNFKFSLSSFAGTELILGSNADQFWYWSKRDEEPGLHFATHEEFPITRLKTPFNPAFMRESLGFDRIKTDDASYAESDKFLVSTTKELSGTGEAIQKRIFIDKKESRIQGVMLTDLEGEVLASAEIQEWAGELPQQILYLWYEEGHALQLTFENVRVNVSLLEKHWEMPKNLTPRVDMGKE